MSKQSTKTHTDAPPGKCTVCGLLHRKLTYRHWTAATKPRCQSCGGTLEKVTPENLPHWSAALKDNYTQKRKSPRGKCRDCQRSQSVPFSDWNCSGGARCNCCGGILEKVNGRKPYSKTPLRRNRVYRYKDKK